MIDLNNVSYVAGTNNILTNLSLKITPGQHTLILGASGSGKTTLLHLLAGLLTPETGTILVDGKDITQLHRLSGTSWVVFRKVNWWGGWI